jgi:hypothetical protein
MFLKLQSTSPYKKSEFINLSFSVSCQCLSTTARATSNEEALEIATQRWPWKKMGDVIYILTLFTRLCLNLMDCHSKQFLSENVLSTV